MFLENSDSWNNVEDLTENYCTKIECLYTRFIFGSNGSRYIRISLCCKEEQLHEALKRIQEK